MLGNLGFTMLLSDFMISFSAVIPASSFGQTTPSKTPLSRVPVSHIVLQDIEIFIILDEVKLLVLVIYL